MATPKKGNWGAVSFKPGWSQKRVETFHKRQEARIEEAGLDDYVHPGDLIDKKEEEPERDAPVEIAGQQDLILRVLAWISRGPTTAAWGVRVWVAGYYLRPQLWHGQTVTAFARSRDVSHQAVQSVMRSWREEFDEVTWPSGRSRNGRTKSDTSQPVAPAKPAYPPGKESFLRASS